MATITILSPVPEARRDQSEREAPAARQLGPRIRLGLLSNGKPNTDHLLEGLLEVLAADGRLSGPFPLSAGWGDIVTGMLAVPALWLVLRRPQRGHSLLAAWNIFGALDLCVAVALGITSAQGSPLQLFDVGAGSAAIQVLPWSFVPTVLVPFYLIAHGILFAQLRQAAKLDGAIV